MKVVFKTNLWLKISSNFTRIINIQMCSCKKIMKVIIHSHLLGKNVDINTIAAALRLIWPPSLVGDTTRL